MLLFWCKASFLSSEWVRQSSINSVTIPFKVMLDVNCLWSSGCARWGSPDAEPGELFLVCIWESAWELWKIDEFSRDAGNVASFSRAAQLSLQSLSFVKAEMRSLGLDRGNLLACCALDSDTESLLHTWPKSSVSQGAFNVFFESKREQQSQLVILYLTDRHFVQPGFTKAAMAPVGQIPNKEWQPIR